MTATWQCPTCGTRLETASLSDPPPAWRTLTYYSQRLDRRERVRCCSVKCAEDYIADLAKRYPQTRVISITEG